MQIPRSYIENYSKTLNVVSEQARRKLADALNRIDYSQDVATVREAVIAVMQPACGASANVAAQLAADFYDGLRERFGVSGDYEAEAVSLREPDATSGAVRAFAQDLVDGKPLDDFIGKCVDRIDYETRRAANECVAYNAKNDPKKPKWARIPAGAETCQWCIMLASRGFTYQSEETASHSHAHCDCRIVPSWDKGNPSVQGYDPDLYYDMWKHPEKYAVDSALDKQQNTELVKINSSQFPDKFMNTKGKRQSFDAFADAVNSVENADPKVREIYSRIGDIAKSPLMPEGERFDVKYGAGKGCVSTYYDRFTDKLTKLTVNIPKMTSENIEGTYRTTCHELGHFVDVLLGKNGDSWLSTQYSGFLTRNYASLPPNERRAAAANYSESVKPKGKVLDLMREADARYKKAQEDVGDWYKAESKKLVDSYQEQLDAGADRYSVFKADVKNRKALRREYDHRYDVACREAMKGVDQLEDIYDALNDGYLRGSVVDGVEIRYGHGSSYYRSNSKKVEEIWANYCSLSLTRPDLIEVLREDQPELIASMDLMRDEILGGLNG